MRRGAVWVGALACCTGCGSGGADASEANQPPEIICSFVGPACGLSVGFEGGALAAGRYAVEVTSTAGVTACEYTIDPSALQTAAEAEAEDSYLSACAANGSCPSEPCSGPDTVSLQTTGLSVREASSSIGIVVENLDTGATSSKVFSPNYSDHPARAGQCGTCGVASGSMAIPQ